MSPFVEHDYDTRLFIRAFPTFTCHFFTVELPVMMSIRTRLCHLRPLISGSSEALKTSLNNGCRSFQTSASLDRIITPRFPDFSPKLIPGLKVQDTVIGEGEPASLKDDPDAPTFEMEDPYAESPPKCVVCENQIQFDYKNVQFLSQFISQFTGVY